MSIFTRFAGIGSGISAVAAYHHMTTSVEAKFPPKLQEHKIGEMLNGPDGQKVHFVGFFGGAENTITKAFDRRRETYFGDKKTAEDYARQRSGKHSSPYVAVLCSDQPIGHADLGSSRYENMYAPISSQAMVNKNVRILYHYEVTHQTASGKDAAFHRGVHSLGLKEDPAAIARRVHKHIRDFFHGIH